MSTLDKKMVVAASILILLGIVFGALGAHVLEKILTQKQLGSFEVAVKYQLYHGLAFLALVSLSHKLDFSLRIIFNCIFLGVIVFSGSIYLLILQSELKLKLGMFFGPLTPIGGIIMIVGWMMFIVKLFRSKYNVE